MINQSNGARPVLPFAAPESDPRGIPGVERVDFLKASLAEKQERVREAAVMGSFCPDRASQSLERIVQIASLLEGPTRDRFINTVAIPLMEREPMDLLKITLSTIAFDNLHSLITNDTTPMTSFFVEKSIEQMSTSLSAGDWDKWTHGEMLPLPSRAIVFHLDSSAEPHGENVRQKMFAMAELLSSSEDCKAPEGRLLSTSTCFHVQYDHTNEAACHGYFVGSHLALIDSPSTSVRGLAATFVHEDLHRYFRGNHWEGGEPVVDPFKTPRALEGEVPFLPSDNRSAEALLNEFHSYVKEAAFNLGLWATGSLRPQEIADFIVEYCQLSRDLTDASAILDECDRQGEFTPKGSALLRELVEVQKANQEKLASLNAPLLKAVFGG